MQKLIIYKDNSLIRGNQGINLHETRIMDIILGKLDQRSKLEGDIYYTINIDDYAERYELLPKIAYRELKANFRGLMEKKYKITLMEDEGTVIKEGVWVSNIIYNDDKFLLRVMFNKEIINLISGFTEESTNYTRYSINNKQLLKSDYEHKFYELCSSWAFKREFIISIEDLRLCLGAESETYNNYGAFKQRVLSPCINKINDKTDLTVSLDKEFKKGKKVTEIKFVIKKGGFN